MGVMQHHAIIVTSFDRDLLKQAHRIASDLSRSTTTIIPSGMNGFSSFAVLPDGAKEGWAESHEGDEARRALITWMKGQAFDDGSNSLSWVEVSFGDFPATIIAQEATHDH